MSKSMENRPSSLSPGALLRKDVLTGVLFIAFAALGLWLSRNYPMGTTLRMGTGYVPRLLCWVLLGLGGLITLQGLLARVDDNEARVSVAGAWRPFVFVGSLSGGGLRVVETVIAGFVLIVLSWVIFIVGLGITIPVWPEW